LGRCPVRLGENNVKGKGLDAGLMKAVHESRENGTGPRPLAEAFEAFIVDIDNPHGGIFVNAGMDTLVIIKNHDPEIFDRNGKMAKKEKNAGKDQSGDKIGKYLSHERIISFFIHGATRDVVSGENVSLLYPPIFSK